MTESTALKAVEEAAREYVSKAGMSQRGYEWAKLRDALYALDRAREEAAQREAKRIHAFRDRVDDEHVKVACGAVVHWSEARNRAREEAAQWEAKRIHAFRDRVDDEHVKVACGAVVHWSEARMDGQGIRCSGCAEAQRGKYCPGGHAGTECVASCWGYVLGVDLAEKGGAR